MTTKEQIRVNKFRRQSLVADVNQFLEPEQRRQLEEIQRLSTEIGSLYARQVLENYVVVDPA